MVIVGEWPEELCLAIDGCDRLVAEEGFAYVALCVPDIGMRGAIFGQPRLEL